MKRQRRRDTRPERAIRSLLHRRGLRYRVDREVIPGLRRRADIVFPGPKVAVFVDGCFWHGCPEHGTWPRSNAAWWREKIQKNAQRDSNTDDLLNQAGWKVVRVWEHVAAPAAVELIERAIREKRGMCTEDTSQ